MYRYPTTRTKLQLLDGSISVPLHQTPKVSNITRMESKDEKGEGMHKHPKCR